MNHPHYQATDYQDYFDAHLRAVSQATDAALAASGFDGLLIHSGTPIVAFQDDFEYPFQANPFALWWAPLVAQPDCAVIYRPGEKPILYYHRPDDYWHEAPVEPDFWWARHFDLRIVRRSDRWRDSHGLDAMAAIGDAPVLQASFSGEALNPAPLLRRLQLERTRKTDYEVACIKAANQRAARGHEAAHSAFRSGASEFDIHQAYLQACGQLATELPYEAIIGLNNHGAVLHYRGKQRKAPDESRSFLIDAGCRVNGYASDITRTYAREPNDFGELIGAMDQAQQRVVAATRAGRDFAELAQMAHRELARVLGDADIVRMHPDAMVESGVTRTFLPHGLGHFLGLQTHDVAGHLLDVEGNRREPPETDPFLRLTRTLEPGNVVTIEPGLYFIDSLLEELREGTHSDQVNWPRVEAFLPFGGIRIEDNVLVTAAEPDNLTRAYLN